MDQCADVMILREEHPPVGGGLGKQRVIARIVDPLADIDNIMTGGTQRPHGVRDNVGVGEEPHPILRRSSGRARLRRRSGARRKVDRRRYPPARARDKPRARLPGWRPWPAWSTPWPA